MYRAIVHARPCGPDRRHHAHLDIAPGRPLPCPSTEPRAQVRAITPRGGKDARAGVRGHRCSRFERLGVEAASLLPVGQPHTHRTKMGGPLTFHDEVAAARAVQRRGPDIAAMRTCPDPECESCRSAGGRSAGCAARSTAKCRDRFRGAPFTLLITSVEGHTGKQFRRGPQRFLFTEARPRTRSCKNYRLDGGVSYGADRGRSASRAAVRSWSAARDPTTSARVRRDVTCAR